MANPSIYAAFERLWLNINSVFSKVGHTHDNYATKSYVDTAVSNLVNSAPETLDTLGELATAFEENQNMVTLLNDAITYKANVSDLEITQEQVDTNTTNISSLQSQVLADSFIIADAITGELYKLQIQNGQLVSFQVTEV